MIPLLDTHQHLIYPDRIGYAWTDNIAPLAHKAFTVANYRELTAGKVGATLFMEAGVDDADYQAETRFVAELAADQGSRIVGLIASCRPETDAGFEAWLDECGQLPVVGFRRILHEIDDGVSQSAGFRANVRKIGRRGKVFDMCFLARQLPIAAELAKACPDMALVLDHCGVPDIGGDGFGQWQEGMTALAALPNVTCKMSGIMAYCPPGTASLDTIRPYLDHMLKVFGPDRMIWGSDWPVVNLANGISDWIAVSRAFFEQLSPAEIAKIASDNAAALYGVSMGGREKME